MAPLQVDPPSYLKPHHSAGRCPTVGTLVGTYAIAAGAARLLFGRLVDTIRYRWSCIGFSAALVAAGLLYVWGTSLVTLYEARVLHGAGLGVFYSVTYGWLGANTPPDQRGRWFGIAGALTGVALVVMPPTGLAIYFRFGIDMVYAAFAVMVALSIPIALDGRPVGTSETSPMLASLILISGTALILTNACIGALEAFMPLLAVDVAQSLLTWLYVAFGLSLVVGRLAGGVLGDRIGHAPLSAVSLLGVAGAMAAVSVSAVYAVLLGAAIVTALGIGGATTNIFASASARTTADRQARVLALLSLVGDVGTGLGAFAAGAVSGGNRNGVLVFIIVAAGVAAVASLRMGREFQATWPRGWRVTEGGPAT